MRFNDIEYGYRVAFTRAWEAYLRNTTPIGCAVITNCGELLASSGNCIYSGDENGLITGHNFAHAEINTLLQINVGEHPDIGGYTLYSTMEPCPLCIGAIVQGELRRVKYAAMDKLAGAAYLGGYMNSMRELGIDIEGPDKILQILQIILLIFRRLERDFSHNSIYIDVYIEYCPEGVALGKRLFSDMYFHDMISGGEQVEKIFDYILSMYA